ncbi:metalloprotease [Xylariomycetidae sp. FL0641]|nr:metalloprotease [Xylariomycetidae sp. FL0641]
MKPSSSLVGLATASAATAAAAAAAHGRCGIDDAALLAVSAISSSSTTAQAAPSRRIAAAELPDHIDVDVHVHITSTTAEADLVTDAILAAQWAVLAAAYARHNITLALASTERVVDDVAGAGWLVYDGTEWVHHAAAQDAFFRRTRRGGYDALNLYFFAPWSPGASGVCTFPTVPEDEDDPLFYSDLCQVSALTMPGIPADKANEIGYVQGNTAVHEAGHWFGLNHTFANGCNQPGDFVADTPATLDVYECVETSNSCPDAPGYDPVHNFMSYTNDSCTKEFTPGQQQRMFETFFSFRRDPAA